MGGVWKEEGSDGGWGCRVQSQELAAVVQRDPGRELGVLLEASSPGSGG